MFSKIMTATGIMILAAATLPADFTYHETTRITGGVVVGAMKMAGVFSKQARQATEPMESTIAVKGNRMVHQNAMHTSIIDLDSQTITSIDPQKKTYSVMTFQELKEALDKMSEKMKQNSKGTEQGQMNFKVSAQNTGKTKQISGFEAKEMVLKMVMEGTDQKSGQSGSMVVNADTWIAPAIPGYAEVREFYKRMATKIAWTPNSNMFMARPDVAQGMAEVYKEAAKLDGMPVFQTTSMGPEGTEATDASSRPAAEQQQQSDKPSLGGALGGALGGRFGLGRKKKDQPPAQDTQQAQGDAANAGMLMEMTTEMTGFSANAVAASMFEVPAGFQKVDSELKRMK